MFWWQPHGIWRAQWFSLGVKVPQSQQTLQKQEYEFTGQFKSFAKLLTFYTYCKLRHYFPFSTKFEMDFLIQFTAKKTQSACLLSTVSLYNVGIFCKLYHWKLKLLFIATSVHSVHSNTETFSIRQELFYNNPGRICDDWTTNDYSTLDGFHHLVLFQTGFAFFSDKKKFRVLDMYKQLPGNKKHVACLIYGTIFFHTSTIFNDVFQVIMTTKKGLFFSKVFLP